jgi:hypothetical protein
MNPSIEKQLYDFIGHYTTIDEVYRFSEKIGCKYDTITRKARLLNQKGLITEDVSNGSIIGYSRAPIMPCAEKKTEDDINHAKEIKNDCRPIFEPKNRVRCEHLVDGLCGLSRKMKCIGEKCLYSKKR